MTNTGEPAEQDKKSTEYSVEELWCFLQQEGYTVVKPLEQGTEAYVFAATSKEQDTEVAIKIARKSSRSLLREFQRLTRFRHPNIVCLREGYHTTFDPMQPDYLRYIVLERGQIDLLRALTKNKKDITKLYRQVVLTCNAILRALRYLHAQGVSFTDLKPDNILLFCDAFCNVRTTGQVKLCDFGMIADPTETNLDKRLASGTVDWCSPETLRKRRNTKEGDIFAFGCILYSICTAHQIFPVFVEDEESGIVTPLSYKASAALIEKCHRAIGTRPIDKFFMSFPEAKTILIDATAPKPKKRPTAEQLLASKFLFIKEADFEYVYCL